MGRDSTHVVIALTVLLNAAPVARAQEPATDSSATGRAPAINRAPGFYHAPARGGPHKLIVDIIVDITGAPPHPNDSPPDTSGQFANFGGALQYYSIFTDKFTTSNAKAPLGANITLPIARDRVELFAGTGGVFAPAATVYTRPDTWLTQAKFGARVALDKGHHLWLGTTAYYLTNFAERTRQWGYASGDLTVQFGH